MSSDDKANWENHFNDLFGLIRDDQWIYPGAVAQAISKCCGFIAPEMMIDQHQSNGLYGVHQLRVRLPGDKTVYRVIIAPADAPISIGTVAADEHFLETIT